MMEKDLPLEVLCKILSYLDGRQRLESGLVCKRWLHASGMLLENICLKVVGGHFPDVASGRQFTRIALRRTYINDSCVDFLNLFEQLLHLTFWNCEVHSLITKTVYCPRLRILETYDMEDVLPMFSSLSQLEVLVTDAAFNFTKAMLVSEESFAPNLKTFLMPYPMESAKSCINLPDIGEFMRKRAPTLKSIRLPPDIHPEGTLSLSQVKNLNLESVSFNYCNSCYGIIADFCRNQPFITVLNVSELFEISDLELCNIVDQLPALQEFIACDCGELDWCVVRLFSRPNMRRLNLSYCSFITPLAFSTAISSLACVSLCVLNLAHTELQQTHVNIFQCVPLLEELDLSGCPLSDVEFRMIFDHLPALQEFTAKNCEFLDRMAIHLFARQNMQRINLESCSSITPDTFSAAISTLACVGLRVLNLSQTSLQDTHTLELLTRLPLIEELDLSSCPLSDDMFRDATCRLTRLRTLRINYCNGLTGRTLGHLSELVSLEMNCCEGLTNEGVMEGVRFRHLRNLEMLELEPDSDIDADLPPNDANFTPNISSFTVMKLKEQNPCLDYYDCVGYSHRFSTYVPNCSH